MFKIEMSIEMSGLNQTGQEAMEEITGVDQYTGISMMLNRG